MYSSPAPYQAAITTDPSEAGAALPDSILRATAHLLGAHHSCPLPLTTYCPPLNLRDLQRLKRGKGIRAQAFFGREYVDPQPFITALVANGLLPADQPPIERQRRLAASAVARSLDHPLFRDELELLRVASDNDSPLPIPYFAEFAGRSTMFEFFALGLPKWRHGRHVAIVPSQLADFLRGKTKL